MRTGKAAVESEWKLIAGTHDVSKRYRRALSDPSLAPYGHMTATSTA